MLTAAGYRSGAPRVLKIAKVHRKRHVAIVVTLGVRQLCVLKCFLISFEIFITKKVIV